MIKFLLGALVGSVATASYLKRQSGYTPSEFLTGRVDELSSSTGDLWTDTAVNAGDNTTTRKIVIA